MRAAAAVVALSLLSFACTATKARTLSPTPPEAGTPHRASQSLLRVVSVTESGRTHCGTGFVVDQGIYTATHIVQGSRELFVLLRSGERVETTGWRQVRGDLALILVADMGDLPPPLPVARSLPPGIFVVEIVGFWYSGSMRVEVVTVRGYARRSTGPVVLSCDPPIHAPAGQMLDTSMPLERGMSGSPVLHRGRVVAIASANSGGTDYSSCARADRGVE